MRKHVYRWKNGTSEDLANELRPLLTTEPLTFVDLMTKLEHRWTMHQVFLGLRHLLFYEGSEVERVHVEQDGRELAAIRLTGTPK